MKNSISKLLFCLLAACSVTLGGCADIFLEEPDIQDEMTQAPEETDDSYRIIAGLHGAVPDSKLTYHEALDGNGKTVMKTLWSEGDKLVVSCSPNSLVNAYTFDITGGVNTGAGVFEWDENSGMNSPGAYISTVWTIYYPGDRIKQDSDFLNFTYNGQVQTGNNNTDHLKDFHTIRLVYYGTSENKIPFKDTYINFDGENLEEPGCIKFKISGLPAGIVPTDLKLEYINPGDVKENVFYTHNVLSSFFGSTFPNREKTSAMNLALEGFSETTDITAYMLYSNGGITVQQGGKFRVTVSAENGKQYYCEKPIGADLTLHGSRMSSITCTGWTDTEADMEAVSDVDGLVYVLQEAAVGKGTDIIIMGDGFAGIDINFKEGGKYEKIMKQAYEDFFSVEPFKTLKPYFNVYYINAVSEDEHDAKPYYDANGSQNGATQGTAVTKFGTTFIEGATNITGNNDAAREYAKMAIRAKGGKGGTPVTDDNEVLSRESVALTMVMVNVPCHAGTCVQAWVKDASNDFGNAYSVAYTSLGNNLDQRRWTTIHEAGGHGFGKLADEYGGYIFNSFSTSLWYTLNDYHRYGAHRNANEYYKAGGGWEISGWPDTTEENVYWSELLSDSYGYVTSEGLGIYEGAKTYDELFCRPTENSVMRSQFSTDGKFFNAISRWAIWYRLMRMTENTSSAQFKESLADFISFDSTLTITKNDGLESKSGDIFQSEDSFLPTAPPVMVECRWENGTLVPVE